VRIYESFGDAFHEVISNTFNKSSSPFKLLLRLKIRFNCLVSWLKSENYDYSKLLGLDSFEKGLFIRGLVESDLFILPECHLKNKILSNFESCPNFTSSAILYTRDVT
jgi:hypothetical protein